MGENGAEEKKAMAVDRKNPPFAKGAKGRPPSRTVGDGVTVVKISHNREKAGCVKPLPGAGRGHRILRGGTRLWLWTGGNFWERAWERRRR